MPCVRLGTSTFVLRQITSRSCGRLSRPDIERHASTGTVDKEAESQKQDHGAMSENDGNRGRIFQHCNALAQKWDGNLSYLCCIFFSCGGIDPCPRQLQPSTQQQRLMYREKDRPQKWKRIYQKKRTRTFSCRSNWPPLLQPFLQLTPYPNCVKCWQMLADSQVVSLTWLCTWKNSSVLWLRQPLMKSVRRLRQRRLGYESVIKFAVLDLSPYRTAQASMPKVTWTQQEQWRRASEFQTPEM